MILWRRMNYVVENYVTLRENTLEFVCPYLAYPSPIEFDCTAGIVCPEGKSCSFQGGYYIHCKHGLVKDWVEIYRNTSFGIFVLMFLGALYFFMVIVRQVTAQAKGNTLERKKTD